MVHKVYYIQDTAKIAARYKVFQSVAAVQWWWRHLEGVDETLNKNTIKYCHWNMIETVNITDKNNLLLAVDLNINN